MGTRVNVNEEIRDEFKFLVKRFTNDAERACSERANQSLHRTLRSLARNADIKLRKFDKENGFAILEAGDYFLKLDRIIEDGSKLQDDAIHPIIQKENSKTCYVKRYLRKVDGYTTLTHLEVSLVNYMVWLKSIKTRLLFDRLYLWLEPLNTS